MATLQYRDPGTGEFAPFVADATPLGSIMGFGGTVAPADWMICDGSPHGSTELAALIGPNTPDLRDRFIVGADATRNVGTTGGASSVTLNAAQSGLKSHTHTGTTDGASHQHTGTFATDGNHDHNEGYRMTHTVTAATNNVAVGAWQQEYPMRHGTGWMPPVAHSHTGTSGSRSDTHRHPVTINASAATTATASHENRPPYFSMIFIMKVA